MARRRRRIEEYSNHDRWLVSYADFITLLFAFFVVMYSISSVNEDKYRVLSDAMNTAFREPSSTSGAIEIDDLVQTVRLMPVPTAEPPESSQQITVPFSAAHSEQASSQQVESTGPERGFSQRVLDKAEAEVDDMAGNVEEHIEDLIDEDIINIKRNKFWLEIEIKSSLLFRSGSSKLIPESVPVLIKLAKQFVELPNRIHIEGFTDNKPINTDVFPSNWELSSARAAAVVRLFERNGVAPDRLASIGYGEYQPISNNDSEEARARNRRVVVVVMASLEGQEDQRIHEFDLLKDNALARTGR